MTFLDLNLFKNYKCYNDTNCYIHMEVDVLLNSMGKALLGITITEAMKNVYDALKLCSTLDEDERWNRLDHIYDLLDDINNELITELKKEHPETQD